MDVSGLQIPKEPSRMGSPGAGVTGSCELLDVLLSPLSSLTFLDFRCLCESVFCHLKFMTFSLTRHS